MDADRLREILDLVQESVSDPEIAGEDLARRAYLSRFHFDRLVSAAFGESPGAFRRRLLLERAATELTEGRRSVLDVALGAGYGGPEAFTRAFNRAYGSSPSAYRTTAPTDHRLGSPNGVHFHPPGSLTLPTTRRSTQMDLLERMLDHHLWLTGEILDRASRLSDAELDRPIRTSVEGIDRDPTLRSILTRLVTQLEMWLAAFDGAEEAPPDGDRNPAVLKARLEVAGQSFRATIMSALEDGRAEETFVDTTCRPVHVFTYGGVLAHVLTFSAVRRTMALGALESAGIDDLGAGDPMTFVGSAGEDASHIRRAR